MPPIQHLIAIGVILFILRFLLGLLGSVSPFFLSMPMQIATYFVAVVIFIIWLYKDSKSKHFNPHDITVQTLAKQGQKKPEVWHMPEDHHKKPD